MPRKRQIKSAKQKQRYNRNSVKKSRKKVRKSRMSGGGIPKKQEDAVEFMINWFEVYSSRMREAILEYNKIDPKRDDESDGYKVKDSIIKFNKNFIMQYRGTLFAAIASFVTDSDIRNFIKYKILKEAKNIIEGNPDNKETLIPDIIEKIIGIIQENFYENKLDLLTKEDTEVKEDFYKLTIPEHKKKKKNF